MVNTNRSAAHTDTKLPKSRNETKPHRAFSDDIAQSRRPVVLWRWVTGAILALIAAQLVVFVTTNDRFEWPVVGEYLFAPTVLVGLVYTIVLAIVTMVLGTVLGTIVAGCQLSNFTPLRWAATVWVGTFRGIPPLVQLIFWYNLAYLVPNIGVGLPFGPMLVSVDANAVITPLTAAIIGLSLMQSAYMAEIIRGGLLGVDSGQRDAARALGFTWFQTVYRVTLPQTMRMIIPPSGSQFISLIKATSLVSVIAMPDLLRSVQLIYNRTYEVVPMLLVACIWYLLIVTVLTIVQRKIERHFSRGHVTAPTPVRKKRKVSSIENRTGVEL